MIKLKAVLLSLVVSVYAATDSLYVDEAPQTLRPYVLPKLAGQAVAVGGQIYRFSVTGNSSDGSFTLMQTNAYESSQLGVLPHIHQKHYENFYCSKGSFQLWAQRNETGEQARSLTQGDYGAVPQNTTHTFQITDPDTQMTGIISPGGFEELFIFLGQTFSTSTAAPFVPDVSDDAAGGGSDSSVISALESYDVYAHLDYNPRRDLVNGTAPSTDVWHNGNNTLAQNSSQPNFIAKNRGPKYLNTENGYYQIISPLSTGEQNDNTFSIGNIVMSQKLDNQTAPTLNLKQHVAFQLEEGQLEISVQEQNANLIQGDVAFIPKNTDFTYHATVPYTKFLYVTGGGDGLDNDLLQTSIEWDYASYPTYSGFEAN